MGKKRRTLHERSNMRAIARCIVKWHGVCGAALDDRRDACEVDKLPVRFKYPAGCPTGRNLIGCCFFMNNLLSWFRVFSNTTSHHRWAWIFFIDIAIFLHCAATTRICSIISFVCPGGYLYAFGKAVPWSLSVGGRWTCKSVSKRALCWFCFFHCFVWETHTVGERLRIRALHKSSTKRIILVRKRSWPKRDTIQWRDHLHPSW